MKKYVFALLGVFAGVLVVCLPVPEATTEMKVGLGILTWAVVWWSGKVLPEYVTALLMAVLMTVLAKIPAQTVFSAFSGSTWWLLMTAFGLGLGMKKSGLLRRMAIKMLQMFPKSFKGQLLGLFVVGTATAPFIPSISAKGAMLAPLSMSISDTLGYERKGRQATGLFLAMYTGLKHPAVLFLSASAIGYALHGHLPEEIRQQFNMVYWFVAALPWFVFAKVLSYFAIKRMYAPKSVAKEDSDEALVLEDLGPISKAEVKMLVIIVTTVVMWVLEPIHGISAHIVSLGALVATMACDLFDRTEFRSGVTWDSLMFSGVVLALAADFAYLGIDQWIVKFCAPMIVKLAQSPYLLVFGISAFTILVRFVVISELAFVNIFMAFMVPLSVDIGINPWVIGMVIYCMIDPWFVLYQNPGYMATYYAVDGQMAEHSELAKYCIIDTLISVAALLLTIPLWISAGVFYI